MTKEDLQYSDDWNQTLQAAREEVVEELENGDISEEQAEDRLEEIDQVQSDMDESGPPDWAEDADEPDNWGSQIGG